jgi:hypothetical protein
MQETNEGAFKHLADAEKNGSIELPFLDWAQLRYYLNTSG